MTFDRPSAGLSNPQAADQLAASHLALRCYKPARMRSRRRKILSALSCSSGTSADEPPTACAGPFRPGGGGNQTYSLAEAPLRLI
jgi:hypothetical protein